jgi:hypothetical protein
VLFRQGKQLSLNCAKLLTYPPDERDKKGLNAAFGDILGEILYFTVYVIDFFQMCRLIVVLEN